MRLETLTGEHNFFSRYELAEDTAAQIRAKWEQTLGTTDAEIKPDH